jgi:hypothetical protein
MFSNLNLAGIADLDIFHRSFTDGYLGSLRTRHAGADRSVPDHA